jgi:pyridoxine 4-dehydrogenase
MSNLFSKSGVSQVYLGDTPLNRIGLGTNRVTDTPDAQQFLRQAVEDGINFIDTAHAYSGGDSETTIGNALAPFNDDLVVATKGGMKQGGGGGDNSEAYLRSNLEDSLKRLKTDCITLYQIHRLDENVPIKQTMELLNQFKNEGKIKYIGLSEVSLEQLKEAEAFTEISSVQNQYSLTYRVHDDVLDYCTEQNIIFIPWFPLRDVNGDFQLQSALEPIAKQYNISPQQLILAWLLKRSAFMLPIPGTLSTDHLRSNIASTYIDLLEDDFERLTNW